MNYIDLHTHNPNEGYRSVEILSLDIQSSPKNLFCFGVHPWDADKISKEQATSKLNQFVKDQSFFGIGEIGLDKYSKVDFEIQREMLSHQLNYCNTNNIRIIQVHLLKSDEEFFKIMKESRFAGKVILHGFNGGAQRIESFLNQEVFCTYVFSIGAILFRQSKIAKAIAAIPTDRVFFETDDQSEFSIEQIYSKASDILKVSETDLMRQVEFNFKHHFTKETFTKR
jgi:TatD DNase family protein